VRRAAAAALCGTLLLAGCGSPAGRETPECGAEWRDVESVVVVPGGADPRPVALECIRQVDDKRLRMGFTLPGGPECWQLSDYRLVESADAVAITLFIARSTDPAAGACAPEPRAVATEMDLQAPVDDRILLDGSTAE
jgi:hypothetical protein